MNKLVDGTEYREVAAGLLAVRGKRELYILGTSVEQIEKARGLLANNTFNRLFSAATKSPHSRSVAYFALGRA